MTHFMRTVHPSIRHAASDADHCHCPIDGHRSRRCDFHAHRTDRIALPRREQPVGRGVRVEFAPADRRGQVVEHGRRQPLPAARAYARVSTSRRARAARRRAPAPEACWASPEWLDRGQQFRAVPPPSIAVVATIGGRQASGRRLTERDHRPQLADQRLGAVAIALVDHEDVADLQDAGLRRLDRRRPCPGPAGPG